MISVSVTGQSSVLEDYSVSICVLCLRVYMYYTQLPNLTTYELPLAKKKQHSCYACGFWNHTDEFKSSFNCSAASSQTNAFDYHFYLQNEDTITRVW